MQSMASSLTSTTKADFLMNVHACLCILSFCVSCAPMDLKMGGTRKNAYLGIFLGVFCFSCTRGVPNTSNQLKQKQRKIAPNTETTVFGATIFNEI